MSVLGVDEKKLAAGFATEIRGLLDNRPVTEAAAKVLVVALTRVLERGIEFEIAAGGVILAGTLRLAKPKEAT